MADLQNIGNFLAINDRLATSGMPQPQDFAAIRQAGFDVVINLALPTSDSAIPNEGELVSAEGMTYVHIPVKFDAPQPADFERFARFMDACTGQRVFVHCVANLRVSAFVFLYRVRSGIDRFHAERDWKRMGEPDAVWLQFVSDRLVEMEKPASA